MKLGIIGCGEITKFMVVMAKLNRRIHVTACADIHKERAVKYASKFKGAQAFDDYREMIATCQLDAVYIAVPHHLHYPMMKDLIAAGIHIFCEKPVATTLEDALDIARLAAEQKIKVGINYQYRYDKACYRAAVAARNGDLGQLYYGTCNIPWSRQQNYFDSCQWHCSQEQCGGGTLITQGSHALDVLLWAFNSRPVRATGIAEKMKFTGVEVEDISMAIIELENGCYLQATSSMIAASEQPLTIDIYGSAGTAKYKSGMLFSNTKFLKAKVPRYSPDAAGIHALGRNLEAFRKWVVHNAPYNNTVEDALPVLAAVLAVYRSAQSGQWEAVPAIEL